MRGTIDHIPIVINIPKKYAQIENKIKSDRDRNSFDNKLVNNFLNIWARSGFHYHSMHDNPAIQYVLEKSRKIWDKGHPLLANNGCPLSQIFRDFSKTYCIAGLSCIE